MTNQSTTTKEALEPCPLAHPIVNGVRFTNFSNNVKAHIWCYDCGLAFEGRVNEPRDKVAERWNSRTPAPIVAPEVDDETKHDYAAGFLRTIAEGLRHAIRDHGPITSEWIGSASKRVYSRLKGTKYVK